MQNFGFLIIFIIALSAIPYSFSEEIPEWVKNNASWWSDRKISQSEFTNGLEFLIKQGIIYVPSTEPGIPGPDKIIPDWVRNTAGWWSQNLIPDSEFINAMKYLIELGIIEVDVSSPEINEEELPVDSFENVPSLGTPLHMLLEGYQYAHSDGKFVLDVKIFDAEKYSGTKFGGNSDYTLDGVTVNISLYNQEGILIHTYSEITQNGFVRYDVMAKETSDCCYWLINNLYTVNVVALLDGQTVEKNYEFLGRVSAYYYNSGDSTKSQTLGMNGTLSYDIGYAKYIQTVDVETPAATPEGLIFNDDGTRMYITDNGSGDRIEQFALSTAWDISSASASGSFDITDGGSNDIEDIAFNADGSRMFVVERADDKILAYELSTSYDVSTASHITSNGDLAIADAVTNNPEDLAFSSNGLKLFILDNDDQVSGEQIFEYNLSSAYDVSTATLQTGGHLTLSDANGNPDAFEFSVNGKRLFVADPTGGSNPDDTILQYELSTAWDVSSATLSKTLDISTNVGGDVKGLAFGDDGNKLYVVDNADDVIQYNINP